MSSHFDFYAMLRTLRCRAISLPETKKLFVRGLSEAARPPLPPFTRESAALKVRAAEDAWNSREPARVALAYTVDSAWRNRSEFVNGRQEIEAFLSNKWERETEYRLIKELFAFNGNRIAVRFAYEWFDAQQGQWYRAYGNENWEFDDDGYMAKRYASINDVPITEKDRQFHWPQGRRPDDHPGLSDLGLNQNVSAALYMQSMMSKMYHPQPPPMDMPQQLEAHMVSPGLPTPLELSIYEVKQPTGFLHVTIGNQTVEFLDGVANMPQKR
ncbi:hypothetical protein BBJ29_003780 [Phytophthora kernoviae]|uniref:DUF1348 domain-containing protein n=1 Tax=Phytophthora kernoviae TaxID=325452 RepID=A0A3F2RPN1_9STRA|nr:hypothetical protein BBJ29_003780 [Phytophthora kernoviae]RLN61784.1 hypothetical protein BBP00_00005193 [Phytophthora kernoviae]